MLVVCPTSMAGSAMRSSESSNTAVQNIVSLFNGALERVKDDALSVSGTAKALTRFAFRDRKTGLGVVALWDGTEVPSNDSDLETVQVTIKGGNFKSPVWIDLITGNIYEIPAEKMVTAGEAVTFHDVPIYDGPVAIADRSLLSIMPARRQKESKPGQAPKAAAKRKGKAGAPVMTQHLLPGTQQPAPAVLICAAKGEDVGSIINWLNAQEVHAFVVG